MVSEKTRVPHGRLRRAAKAVARRVALKMRVGEEEFGQILVHVDPMTASVGSSGEAINAIELVESADDEEFGPADSGQDSTPVGVLAFAHHGLEWNAAWDNAILVPEIELASNPVPCRTGSLSVSGEDDPSDLITTIAVADPNEPIELPRRVASFPKERALINAGINKYGNRIKEHEHVHVHVLLSVGSEKDCSVLFGRTVTGFWAGRKPFIEWSSFFKNRHPEQSEGSRAAKVGLPTRFFAALRMTDVLGQGSVLGGP